jgi:hypothetical protein
MITVKNERRYCALPLLTLDRRTILIGLFNEQLEYVTQQILLSPR